MYDGRIPLTLVYDVEFHKVGLTAGFIDLRDQGVAALLIAAGDEHCRTLFRKQ